jgi:hypothetical protein
MPHHYLNRILSKLGMHNSTIPSEKYTSTSNSCKIMTKKTYFMLKWLYTTELCTWNVYTRLLRQIKSKPITLSYEHLHICQYRRLILLSEFCKTYGVIVLLARAHDISSPGCIYSITVVTSNLETFESKLINWAKLEKETGVVSHILY